MAVDLLARSGLTITDTGEADTLEADLLTLLLTIRRVLRHPQIRRIVGGPTRRSEAGGRDPPVPVGAVRTR